MQVALVGLSQSGKSTLFRAITEGQAHASASGVGQVDKVVVKVPDERLEFLSGIYKPKKTTHATIEFLDLPGFSFADESHCHEARRLIAEARQVEMLVMVVCGFSSPNVAAYRDRVDPAADLEELKSEFLLADLELVAARTKKLEVAISKPSKTQDDHKRELTLLQRCNEVIENLKPISEAINTLEDEKLLRSFGFLTLKPICIVLNVAEEKMNESSVLSSEMAGGEVLALSATLEAELAALKAEERWEFLTDMGLEEIARDRLVRLCYQTLNLVSFLTVGADEVRAWTVPADCHAVEAAGQVHSDIQRGFIRAETVAYSDFQAVGDMKGAKAAGKIRLEGKTYPVQDGDIINFRFNV